MSVSAGDRLTANIASDADWIVPEVEGEANPSNDTVSGRCFDTGTSLGVARVLLFRAGHRRGDAWPNVEADGSFAFDFTDGGFYVDPAVIKSGDRLEIMCMQTGGDWVQRVIFAGAKATGEDREAGAAASGRRSATPRKECIREIARCLRAIGAGRVRR